jgi:hypothetical protein
LFVTVQVFDWLASTVTLPSVSQSPEKLWL